MLKSLPDCRVLPALLLLAGLFGALPAHAWSALGHRLVCDIAWRAFTPATRTEVRRLLKHTDYTGFDWSCTWADRVKQQEAFEQTRPYHYINVPRTARAVKRSRDCNADCALWAIDTYSKQLAGDAPEAVRARALMFLAHFVGDVHEPMHVSYADDRGGNDVKVTFFGEATNLHYVWDRSLITRTPRPDSRRLGKVLYDSITAGQCKRWLAVSDPAAWADESFRITRTAIYPDLKRGRHYGAAYFNRYHPVALKRIEMAGIRLAALLERLLVRKDG